MRFTRLELATPAAGLLAALLGCSSPAEPAAPGSSGGAGGQSGAASLGGAAGAGGAGADSSSAGGATAGSAGQSAAGSAGTAGSGGAAVDAFACAHTMSGNGIHEQAEPFGRPPEAFAVDGVPTGTLSALTAYPSALYNGHEFAYRLYVPAQYQAGKPAALIVFQDGPSHYLGLTDAKFYAQHVLDNLIAAGEIPVSIALFVDVCMQACEGERVAIYDAPTDLYARFLSEEILPDVVLSQYDVLDDPDAWATVGFSAGAIQGFTALWNKPDLFHKFIGHNTSFPASKALGVDYEKLIGESAKRELRVSLVSGTADLSDERGNWLEANTAVANALIAKGNDVRLMTGSGGHYPPDQSSMNFPNALRWLFAGCPVQ